MTPALPDKRMPQWALLILGACLVAAAYWIGLRGPFLLDDFGNLADVGAWLDGERSWQSTILNNRSGIGGRPLSMASFVLDAALWGKDVWHFKLTNLLLHLGCGIIAWRLLRRLIARDPDLSRHAAWLPLLLALVWLALPIHASSVLYVVQRMTILSALFVLLALWLYMAAREWIEVGDGRGPVALLLGVPALTGVAFFSKENGALVPLLALAIEIGYFRRQPRQQRSWSVRSFFCLLLAVPAALFVLRTALNPQWVLGGYELREFSFTERLLTQPRILWDYVGSILLPHGPSLGLFHDNYPKSTSLLSPWTTLVAMAAWVASVIVAWYLRRGHPAILTGLLVFLAGHAMESSVFALELYFEHRNYLPSIGILLATAGTCSALLGLLPKPTPIFRFTLVVTTLAVVAVLIAATHGRARVWSSLSTLYAQELRYNPDSPRLQSFLAGHAIRAGDTDTALEHIAVAERNQHPRQAMTSTLWKLLAYCPSPHPLPDSIYDEAASRAIGKIETFAMTAWEELAQHMERGECPNLDSDRVIAIGQDWIAQNPLPPTAMQSWRTRYYLARLLAVRSHLEEAAALGEEAWVASAHNNGIGVFLFQVNASLGREDKCREILDWLRRARGGDLKLNQAIDTFEAALARGEV